MYAIRWSCIILKQQMIYKLEEGNRFLIQHKYYPNIWMEL